MNFTSTCPQRGGKGRLGRMVACDGHQPNHMCQQREGKGRQEKRLFVTQSRIMLILLACVSRRGEGQRQEKRLFVTGIDQIKCFENHMNSASMCPQRGGKGGKTVVCDGH